MLKKRIILILLLISLITNVSVFATDVDTDGNTTTGEIVSPPTENTVTGNTEQKPEKSQKKKKSQNKKNQLQTTTLTNQLQKEITDQAMNHKPQILKQSQKMLT